VAQTRGHIGQRDAAGEPTRLRADHAQTGS
jgi:hypothetical protein